MATQYLSYRSIISIPVFGNLSVLYSKHVKSERLMVLSVKAARPRLSHIDHDHIVFTDDTRCAATAGEACSIECGASSSIMLAEGRSR